jgi:uncharacterized protein (DUF2062 family)
MGIVPIWGLQLVVAIALAFLFKLNKALVIIAANISIPPMIPVILFVSHLTGTFWMGENAQYISFSREITLEMLANNLTQYLLGATTLAVVSGFISTGFVYVMIKIFKKFKTTVNLHE